jgi:hypothetical protein
MAMAVLVALVASAGCTASGGDGAAEGGTGAVRTADSAPSPSATGGGLAGPVDCYVVAAALLPPARAGGQATGFALLPGDEQVAMFEQVGRWVPDELERDWSAFEDTIRRFTADPESVGPKEVYEANATWEEAAAWGRRACPDAPPSWQCSNHQGFQTVGRAIDENGVPIEPNGPSTLEDAQATVDDLEHAVELDRTPTAVLYGWVGSDGFLERTEELRLNDGDWSTTGSVTCLD